MKKLTILLLSVWLFNQVANSQGCVIVRNISGFGQYNLTDNGFSTSDWQLNITNRYFKSFRDYRGTSELKFPADSINTVRSFSTEFSISRFFRNGWSLSLNIPVSINSRESKLEHGGIANPFHKTHSFGINDIRFTVYKWLLPPTVKEKFNLQLGVGIKLPTGDYQYQDYFYRKEDSAVLAPVNPSIQLGDGGTGIIAELNSFYKVNNQVVLYANLFYLSNPRDINGTSVLLGRIPTTPGQISQLKAGAFINSVPDQYSLRTGVFYNLDNISISLGIRDEGTPVYDLIGKSNGGRRAGHNLSVEPGLIFKLKKASIYTYVPLIVSRKIKQTVTDKKETELGIIPGPIVRQGGFANFLVFTGIAFKL